MAPLTFDKQSIDKQDQELYISEVRKVLTSVP